MIFVTVGTHEQPFDRLVKYIDKLKEKEIIEENVIMQTGFSIYEPKYCKWNKLFSYNDMYKNIAEARIVITHGGPSSFIIPLQAGKIPIVVPRQKKFNEHVNNHQLEFVKIVEERQGNIIVIEDIENLQDVIMNYNSIITVLSSEQKSNNVNFNKLFGNIVDDLMQGRK